MEATSFRSPKSGDGRELDLKDHFAPFIRGAGDFKKTTRSIAHLKEVRCVLEVVNRFEKAVSQGALYEDLKSVFLNEAERDREWAASVFPLFVIQEKRTEKVHVLFDVDDLLDEEYPSPYEKKIQENLGSILLQTKGPDVGDNDDRDVYGFSAVGSSELMPEVTLGSLGPRQIYSLNKNSLCQKRYGRIGPEAFRVGKDSRAKITDSINWLVDKNRMGKTWANISDLCGYSRSILCAYVEDPKGFIDSCEMISFLAPGRAGEDLEEPDDSEAIAPSAEILLTSKTEAVITALKGVVDKHPDVSIRTFVLSKVDPGRTRVLEERSTPGSTFIDAAERWKENAKNIPFSDCRMLPFGSKLRVDLGGIPPRPCEVSCLLDQRWIREGQGWTMGTDSFFQDGFDLLFGNADLGRMMRLAVENGTPLLLSWSSWLAASNNDLKKAQQFLDQKIDSPRKAPGERYETLKKGYGRTVWLAKFPALVGILLGAIGRRKETYMKDSPYLIGRLLALADLLHQRYCRRDDQNARLPARLLGNSLMVIAGRTPQKALAMLQERWGIYCGWGIGANDRRALWAISKFGEISQELAEKGIPERLTDAGKAELLLGFAAGLRKDKENDEEYNIQNPAEEAKQ